MRHFLLLIALASCQSRLTGNEGNFAFSYWTDDDFVDFNKPIAVGASLDLEVTDVGAGLPVTLTSATAEDSAVLAVASFAGNVVTVTGVSDGEALLSVAGDTSAGASLTDSLNLLVATPEVLRLWHGCTGTDGTAHYLAGQRVWVPYEMSRSNGQDVIGYGYYPVDVAGTSALNAAESNQTWLAFDTVAGVTTLASQIDDASLDLDVVAATAIDGVAEPIAGVIEDIDVGDTNPFSVFPTVGGVSVCQADTAKEVVSDSPEICEVRDADAADEALREYGWFEIEGVAAGTCLYTVTFTESGANAQFSYPIEP
jgi:hypothetical protein